MSRYVVSVFFLFIDYYAYNKLTINTFQQLFENIFPIYSPNQYK